MISFPETIVDVDIMIMTDFLIVESLINPPETVFKTTGIAFSAAPVILFVSSAAADNEDGNPWATGSVIPAEENQSIAC